MQFLPLLVLALALIFFLLKLSGIFDESQAGREDDRPRLADQEAAPSKHEDDRPESDRLRVFREFIDQLPPPGDEPPATPE